MHYTGRTPQTVNMKSAKGKVSPELEEKITRYFDDARERHGNQPESNFESRQTYSRIQASIFRKENRRGTFRGWYQAVAAVLLVITAATFFFNRYHLTGVMNQMAMQEKKAAPGTLTRMVLPDGTEIWLNAGSKIIFPRQFAKDKREVTLEGEAFFNVRHEKKRPFLIHTKDMITQVLGTSFNVSSYPQDKEIKVTVISGKVAVYEQHLSGKREPAKPIFLTANQQATYSKEQKSFVLNKRPLRSIDAAAWKEGNLVFKDTELREVVQRLERKYAIQIEMDSTLRCPVTVNFNDEPLERVMRVLGQLVNGQVSHHEGHYQLTDVLCQ